MKRGSGGLGLFHQQAEDPAISRGPACENQNTLELKEYLVYSIAGSDINTRSVLFKMMDYKFNEFIVFFYFKNSIINSRIG